jgi:NADH-quinone oxidoreductase subunit J
MEQFLFYTLAAILIGFAILTVMARNPVRSAVYLISALLAVAGLFFLLQAEFVGAVQILVYVGGIMVLFLFVIMLVSLREAMAEEHASRHWKAGVALAVVLSVELIYLLLHGPGVLEFRAAPGIVLEAQTLNTESVGIVLYTTYLLPFEIASVLLLVAIVGAVVLAKRRI